MNDLIFHRTRLLTGLTGWEKLKNSRVAIIGLGGVGSYAAESIARCGVGHITIVDPDKIEPSNINRQLPALNSTVGRYKTDVVAERLLDINPELDLHKFCCSYNIQNSKMILNQHLDYVIDAIDSLPDKVHLIKTCISQKIPLISSMGTANRVNPSKLQIADLKDTSTCPLARKLRRELRQHNITSGVKVVYSSEPPREILSQGKDKLGSMSFVTGVAGLLLASFVINSLWEPNF